MKEKLQTRVRWAVTLACGALLIMLLLAACTPNAQEFIISPNMADLIAQRDAGAVVEAIPTPAPILLTDLSLDEQLAGVPDEVKAEFANANSADIQPIITTYGCIGCHGVEAGKQYTGASWRNVGNHAANRVKGQSPGLYIYTSITDPNAFVVEGYTAGIMPQNFKERMSPKELATIMKYMFEQTQE